jgi:hypothetical protein
MSLIALKFIAAGSILVAILCVWWGGQEALAYWRENSGK